MSLRTAIGAATLAAILGAAMLAAILAAAAGQASGGTTTIQRSMTTTNGSGRPAARPMTGQLQHHLPDREIGNLPVRVGPSGPPAKPPALPPANLLLPISSSLQPLTLAAPTHSLPRERGRVRVGPGPSLSPLAGRGSG